MFSCSETVRVIKRLCNSKLIKITLFGYSFVISKNGTRFRADYRQIPTPSIHYRNFIALVVTAKKISHFPDFYHVSKKCHVSKHFITSAKALLQSLSKLPKMFLPKLKYIARARWFRQIFKLRISISNCNNARSTVSSFRIAECFSRTFFRKLCKTHGVVQKKNFV